MNERDLIFPGDLASYRVAPADNMEDDVWSVYIRPGTGDIAIWTWVADFQHESDAREYAAWQAKRS